MSIETEVSLAEGLKIYDDRAEHELREMRAKINLEVGVPTYRDSVSGQLVPFDGRLPDDITALSDDQLGYLLGILSQWIAYVSAQYAVADIRARSAESKLTFCEAKLWLTLPDKMDGHKLSVADKNRMVIVDQRYVRQNAEYEGWSARARFLKPMKENAESAWSAISRRITQRTAEARQTGRMDNVDRFIPDYRIPR